MNSDDQTTHEWSEAELAQLAQAKADDPTTWPARMVRELENHLHRAVWLDRHADSLQALRLSVLEEALKNHVATQFVFVNECIQALFQVVGKGTIGWEIVFRLDIEAPYSLVTSVAAACLDLVPRLNRTLPAANPNEILSAMLKDA